MASERRIENMFKDFFRIGIASALVCLVGGSSLAEIVDPDNNVLPDSADLGDIDMSKTKIVDLKNRIAPGYQTVGLTNDVLWVDGWHTNLVVKQNDQYGNPTSITIGERANGYGIGELGVCIGSANAATDSLNLAIGDENLALGYLAMSIGYQNRATDWASFALGYCAVSSNENSFVWQGTSSIYDSVEYGDHGIGTYNINPIGGIDGVWIGETNFAGHVASLSPNYTKALTNSLYNFENNAGYYIAVRDMAIAMGASVTNDPYAPIPTPTPPPAATGKRYAMFIVPVNNETGGQFVGFELKASTNNFENASSSQNILFYAQSEVANSGYSTGGNIDKMKLFVCSNYGGGDFRSYKKIGNTLSWNYELTEVVVIVDSACLVRNPDPDGNWLDSENDELTWVYTRNRNNSPAYEYETGAGKALWRPIAPVKWFSKLPKWAEDAW